jgi:hypothetical protein
VWSCPPSQGVQQHDPVGVEGAVQGEQDLVAAEEPDVRGGGHVDRPLGDLRCVRVGRAQGQWLGFVDGGHQPVLQRDGVRADLPMRVGRQRLARARHRRAQRLACREALVEVLDEPGRGIDVAVVAHRHHARHALVGDLAGQRP